MNKEEISRLLDTGINILNQAKSTPHSSNYADLLVEAKRNLDQAVSLTERGDPSFNNYVHTWASVHALCLAVIDFSDDLDSYLASSPLVETLINRFCGEREQSARELYVDDQELDDFWAGVGQIQDERYNSLDNPFLFSPKALVESVDALGEAVSRSIHSASSSRIWSLCHSVVLYMRMDLYNPSEILLCISSLANSKAAVNNQKEDPPSSDMDPFLLESLDSILHSSQKEFRLNALQSLAAFYAQRHLFMFKKLWGSYQINPGANSANLDDAISTSFEGILWTRDVGNSNVIRFDLIFGYAGAVYERFNVTQRLEDLEDVVPFLQEVQSYSGIADDKMVDAKRLNAAVLADLAYMLSESREVEDWEKSLAFWRQSVVQTEPDAPDLAGRLFESGHLAFKLYTASGNLKSEYFLEARDAYKRAAVATTDTSFIAQILFELASISYTQFLDARMQEDFDDSLRNGTKACELVRQTPSLAQDNPCWVGVYVHCVKLVRSVQENFKQEDRAILERLEQVIELSQLIIPHPNPNRLLAMNRLGLAYTLLARVQRRGGESTKVCLSSLERALEFHEAALKETQHDDFLLHVRLSFIGQAYYQVSDLPGIDEATRIKHLDLSIDYLQRARLANKSDLSYSIRLAKALEDRYKLLKQPSDLDECASVLSEEGTRFGHSKVFLDAAIQLVDICRENNLHEKAIPAYKRVFTALRKMTQLGLSSTERQDAIVYSVGHACDAAAAALRNDQASVAVELLEEGRNLFFSQLLPIQMNTTAIRLQDPDLALYLEETLEKIRQYHRATDSSSYQTNHAFDEGGFADDINEVARDRTSESQQLLHYGKELEYNLQRVRKLPGLSNFMDLQPFSQLKQAAQRCPVVYLNISRFRCDALVIGGGKHESGVLVVPLPTTAAKVLALSQTMRRTVVQQGRGVRDEDPEDSEDDTRAMVQKGIKRKSAAEEVKNVLRLLWDTIVRPVLLALDYLKQSNAPSPENLPHVCWCPSGPSATFLPLHAAGDYARGPEHWAMTHVVSTYTPTLSSLLHSFERESHIDAQNARMLLISQPASPPERPLPGVVVERDRILATFEEIKGPGNVTSLHDEAGRVEEVVKQLSSHEMLHLACHGIQDMLDPLESSVILHDGNLTIREIIKNPLSKAQLVYLSACQTATGSITTPDESFSLAGSFLFAGYQGAVATMWSINDRDGCDVATSFYTHVLQKDGSPVANAALALHCAVQELREDNPGMDPIRWIPFVYFGVPGASAASMGQATA
ncbi:CHAT domain-containing protein [Rhizoctonia solani]|nr:CHAT domain-containing protein [Rhizoctonia solani]